MSRQFIEAKENRRNLDLARRQQKDLAYLTRSDLQGEIDREAIQRICENARISKDPLIRWVSLVFTKDNFRSFAEYLRFPLGSSRIVENEIIPMLERVFHSEDSFQIYDVRGESILPRDVTEFTKEAFRALLFRYNDIIIHDMVGINEPFREIISLERVVSIRSRKSEILQIAYRASITISERVIDGFIYMDSENYIFYDKDFRMEPIVFPHDLGVCPADYISDSPFSEDNDVVRNSIFSRTRELMEEYVFLRTLQKMTDPNGAIPIVTKLESADDNQYNEPDDQEDQNPISSTIWYNSNPQLGRQNKSSSVQTGTVHEVPIIRTESGAIDTAVAEKYINFFRTPVDSLGYVNERLQEIRRDIIVSVAGDSIEPNEAAMNEMQVSKSFIVKQDKLRKLGQQMARIRMRSDWKILALEFGPQNVSVDISFGTDFFVETQQELYSLYSSAPNPVERHTLLVRLAMNRSRNNPRRQTRDRILYLLLPYPSDKDFNVALTQGIVGAQNLELQTRFNYFINTFEANFGDIVVFWEALGDIEESAKLVLIKNLLTTIIDENGTNQEKGPAEEGNNEE